MKPFLHLIERTPTTCLLSGVDVEFLLAHHRRHLRLLPTGQAGFFTLTPTRLVGVLDTPGVRIVISPKLSSRAIGLLIDPDAPPEPLPGDSALPPSLGLVDLLTLHVLRRIEERVRLGLHRAYREIAVEGPYLQGRLDVAAQMRDPAQRDVLHSRRDELTADVPCNRLLKATLTLLRRTMPAFDEVADVSPVVEDFTAAASRTPDYASLLHLCSLVLQGTTSAVGAGGPEGSFLLDLERLYERRIGRGFREHLAGHPRLHVEEQKTTTISFLRFRPDVVVCEGEDVRLIVDAKWKRAFSAGDVHQALAYAAVLGSPRVILVRPGRRDGVEKVDVPHAGLSLELHSIRLVGKPTRFARVACCGL